MGRFWRAASKDPDSVNEERFKSFVDRINQWGQGGPGLAPRHEDRYSYEEFFGTPPYESRLQELLRSFYPETPSVDSFDDPLVDDGLGPPIPPPAPAFHMIDGKLYASDTTATLPKNERKDLLTMFLRDNPGAQAGVDAWRTPSAKQPRRTTGAANHPGAPTTSGDWTGEQKPIIPPLLAAQPASPRATGGPRSGVPVQREAWSAPIFETADSWSLSPGRDNYATAATQKYKDDYAFWQRRGNLSIGPAKEYKTRFDEGMAPAADIGLLFAGGGSAVKRVGGLLDAASAKRAAKAQAAADDAMFAAREAERLRKGLAASARWRRAQYAANEAEVASAALRRNAAPFWRAAEDRRNWRAYTRPGD